MLYLDVLRAWWRSVKLTALLLVLLLALAVQYCHEPARPRAVCSFSPLVSAAHAAGLPGGLVYLARPHQWATLPAWRDTSRARAASLQRKALPRCRWAISGSYLVFPPPRRPRQAALDSAAAAARRPKP